MTSDLESENDGDVEENESGSEDEEGSMWEHWKGLRAAARRKPEGPEDYSQYYTNSLW